MSINSIESSLLNIDNILNYMESRFEPTTGYINERQADVRYDSQRNQQLNRNNDNVMYNNSDNFMNLIDNYQSLYNNNYSNNYYDNNFNDNDNNFNDNDNNFNDNTDALQDFINNSLNDENEHNHNGIPITENDSSILDTKYKRIGKLGECNICYDDNVKVCKCGSCSFQYCKSCLIRIIKEFGCCSSCGDTININELTTIDSNESNHNGTCNNHNGTCNNHNGTCNNKCKKNRKNRNNKKSNYFMIIDSYNDIDKKVNIQKNTCKNYWIINIKEVGKKNTQINFNNSLFKHNDNFNMEDIMCFYKLITHDIMSHLVILEIIKKNKYLIINYQDKKKEFMKNFYNSLKCNNN